MMSHPQNPVLREGMWLMTQGGACVCFCVCVFVIPFFVLYISLLLLSDCVSSVLNSVL